MPGLSKCKVISVNRTRPSKFISRKSTRRPSRSSSAKPSTSTKVNLPSTEASQPIMGLSSSAIIDGPPISKSFTAKSSTTIKLASQTSSASSADSCSSPSEFLFTPPPPPSATLFLIRYGAAECSPNESHLAFFTANRPGLTQGRLHVITAEWPSDEQLGHSQLRQHYSKCFSMRERMGSEVKYGMKLETVEVDLHRVRAELYPKGTGESSVASDAFLPVRMENFFTGFPSIGNYFHSSSVQDNLYHSSASPGREESTEAKLRNLYLLEAPIPIAPHMDFSRAGRPSMSVAYGHPSITPYDQFLSTLQKAWETVLKEHVVRMCADETPSWWTQEREERFLESETKDLRVWPLDVKESAWKAVLNQAGERMFAAEVACRTVGMLDGRLGL